MLAGQIGECGNEFWDETVILPLVNLLKPSVDDQGCLGKWIMALLQTNKRGTGTIMHL